MVNGRINGNQLRRRARPQRSNRRTNPMTRQVARAPRPRMNFDGTVLRTSNWQTLNATSSNIGANYQLVSCTNSNSMSDNSNALTVLYSEYKYLRAAVEFIPAVSPGSVDGGGQIHMAYFDNPEMINTAAAASAATLLAIVLANKTVRSHNLWERFTYNVPLTWRHKMFDVNLNLAGTLPPSDINETSRSVQGMVAIVCTTPSSGTAALIPGSVVHHIDLELRGLNLGVGT